MGLWQVRLIEVLELVPWGVVWEMVEVGVMVGMGRVVWRMNERLVRMGVAMEAAGRVIMVVMEGERERSRGMRTKNEGGH